MSGQNKSGKWRSPVALLLAGLTLFNAGCLAVGIGAAAAGGAATYFYFKGKICQEYPSTFADSWQATLAALRDLQLPVDSQKNDGVTGTLTSHTADNSSITIDFSTQPSRIPAEGSVTRVCIRVGTFGDQALSEKVLARVGEHLVPQHLVPRPDPTATTRTTVVPAPSPGPIQPAGWNRPSETAPPPELPPAPTPVGPR